jgi:uncharacterized RDD family membrane protein YckC
MSELRINTTQNIPLFFSTPSVGARMLAYGLDLVIKLAYLITLGLIMTYSGFFTYMNGWNRWNENALLIALYAPVAFYSLSCECLMEGQTFGKKMMKIKVVKIDGYQASFSDYVTRWLFRLVDIDMGFIVGLLSMLITKHTQRLGDIAAGTAVISEKVRYNISHTILMDVGEDYVPTYLQSQVLHFNDNDIRIIKENSIEAVKNQNEDLLIKLTSKIENVMKVKSTFHSRRDFINKVIEDYNFYTRK